MAPRTAGIHSPDDIGSRQGSMAGVTGIAKVRPVCNMISGKVCSMAGLTGVIQSGVVYL